MGGYSGDAHNNGNNALASSSSFPRFLTTTTELAITHNARHQPFLEIPAAFWRQHSSAMQEVLTLQGGDSGCEWQVSLCNGGFYDGWKAFAMDHFLKKGEHLVFTLVANDRFVVHIFDEFGSEKPISRGLSSKEQRQQLHCIHSQEDDDITGSGVSEKQKPPGALMHENGAFVLACHSGAGKAYGGGEHANVSPVLDMKVTDESEHGHKPCGIQAGDTTISSCGKDLGITAALQVKQRKPASASSRLPSSWMRTPTRVILARSAIARARQKKLLEDTGKGCGTLQSKDLYSAKDEEEEVLFHNESITHSDDHVFLHSGTRCSSEHDTQNRFSASGCVTGLTTSLPLEQMKTLHSTEKSSKLRYTCSSYGTTGYFRNCYKEDSITEGVPVKSNTMRGDPTRGLLREQQTKGEKEQCALESEEHGEQNGITCCRSEEKSRDPAKLEVTVDYSKHLNMHAVQGGIVAGQDCGSPDEGKNATAGRQQKCSSDIAASDGTTALGLTSGSGQTRRGGGCMEKNMLVKSADSSVLHEEAALQDVNGMIDRAADNEFQKPNVIEGKKYDALDAAHAFETESKKPCVLVVMKPSYVQRNFAFGVPAKASREHFPKTDAAVTLVDIAGKTWSALWHKQRKYINGAGWKDFALAHHLKEGDVCVLEVVQRAASQLKLLVHIFPVVEVCDHVSNGKTDGRTIGPSVNGAVSTRLGTTLVEPTNSPSAFSSEGEVHKEFHGKQNTKIVRNEGCDTGKKRKKLETSVATTLIKKECVTGKRRKMPAIPVATVKSCQAVNSAKKKKQGYLIKRTKSFPTKGMKQRRNRRVISTSHIAPTAVKSEAIQNAGNLYHIVRLIDRRIGPNGVLYLVEIEGAVRQGSNKGSAEQDKDGNWWVPSNHFTSDFVSCFID